ncbi:unnamed protein product [Cylicocyclus nassatus]|uniref:Uncharacterized protein n=1 Tax=Cylicocyclus nassatus TaxID=53992 RepID=A0AA36GUD9_CYLNA|nr:unnamed protein product [Cylicocyclus nassatus]
MFSVRGNVDWQIYQDCGERALTGTKAHHRIPSLFYSNEVTKTLVFCNAPKKVLKIFVEGPKSYLYRTSMKSRSRHLILD